MRLAMAIPISLILIVPAAGQDAPNTLQVQPGPAVTVPSSPPPAARLMDAERQLLERAARRPIFAYAPDPTIARSSRGTRNVTVYRGPQEAVTYRVPKASHRW